jgi:hypothetical protein
MKQKKELKKIRENQIVLMIMAMTIIVITLIPHVAAQTITMANPNGIAERDIIVYFGNGTLSGFYNSTSVITLDGSLDYIFTMKPVQTNLLEDPAAWLTENAFPFVQTNFIPLFLLGFLVSVWAVGRR